MRYKAVETRVMERMFSKVFYHVHYTTSRKDTLLVVTQVQSPVERANRITVKEFLGWAIPDEIEV